MVVASERNWSYNSCIPLYLGMAGGQCMWVCQVGVACVLMEFDIINSWSVCAAGTDDWCGWWRCVDVGRWMWHVGVSLINYEYD